MKQLSITITQKLRYTILTFILDNELENAKTAKSVLPEFHLSETWILAKSCLLKAMPNINNLILACW